MPFDRLIGAAEEYYSGKFAEHGASARGVDWNSDASQELRFEQLLKVRADDAPFTIVDYGCGYGALVDFLRSRSAPFAAYTGFDVARSMLEHARETYGGEGCRFVDHDADLERADYVVASGIFNVKFDADGPTWTEYVVATVRRLWELSARGCSFNMLTSYSDPDKMRPDLYYGDPRFFFDLCRRELSRHVALLHDYGLWEFTVIVRSEPA